MNLQPTLRSFVSRRSLSTLPPTRAGALIGTLVLAVTLAAPLSASARSLSADPAPVETPQSADNQGHVYLCVSSGMADVTNTLYTANGQTYAVYQNQSVAIVLDRVNGRVLDTNGSVIGAIAAQ